ncbi:hypothetical protein [Streptomyces pimonensis]|uniref:hypothetical protein n=1 Tax=Streptomyces pimonensis TaxID=2860288 RepID=UPI0035293B9D
MRRRPSVRRPEAGIAVPAAGVVPATGAIRLEAVREEDARFGPVIDFLTAVLVPTTLLWRRVAHHHAREIGPTRFTLPGPASVPAAPPTSDGGGGGGAVALEVLGG